MRDILVIAIVLAGCIAAFKRPWVGVMLWTWISIMSPHRYTWGVAHDAPLAAMAAGCTFLGLLMTRERASPIKGSPVAWFVAFMVWMTLSLLIGLSPSGDYEQWKKVMKIDLMLLVALALLHSREHIISMMWVCAGSLALLGAKGGVFTLRSGGTSHVWGPPGSFIEDNNEFALALVTIIPLLRFLQLQIQHRAGRAFVFLLMVLCAVSALGSQSRGALLAISAMSVTLWWRGKNKLQIGILLIAVAVPLVAFMPEQWSTRMGTIQTYEEDHSAMGRISAWWNAWNLAWHYPFGVGFNAARPELFAKFSPYPDMVQGAHSIYFLALGNHGFIGLFLFLAIWGATWRSAGWLRTQKSQPPEAKWTADLGAMCQVALAGYFVGGAFLSLTYFDLPYNIMAMIVLTRVWVEKQSWKTEPVNPSRWKIVLGLARAKNSNFNHD
jgi:putative inorganic carbon (HCO3(-)) transporter